MSSTSRARSARWLSPSTWRATAWNRLPAPAEQRPENSRYYGPDRSLQRQPPTAQPLRPLDVIAWDLSDWDRPPAGVSGLFSGDLSSLPGPAVPPVRWT